MSIVAEGAVGIVKGVGSTGVKVVKGTVKGVVATAETTVDLATGKDSAGRVVNLVARGAKDGVTTFTNKSLDIAQGKFGEEIKSRIIMRSPMSRDLKTYPVVGTKPFWNECCTISVDEEELKACLENDSLGISLFLVQGEDDDEVTSSTFVPIRSLLVDPQIVPSTEEIFSSILPNGRSGETPLRQVEIPFGAPYLPSLINVPTGSHCISLDFTILGAFDLSYPRIIAGDDAMQRESSNILANMLSLSSGPKSVSLQVKLIIFSSFQIEKYTIIQS